MSLSCVPGSVVSSLTVQTTPWLKDHCQPYDSDDVFCGSRMLKWPRDLWCNVMADPSTFIIKYFQPIEYSGSDEWSVTSLAKLCYVARVMSLPSLCYHICTYKCLRFCDSQKTVSFSYYPWRSKLPQVLQLTKINSANNRNMLGSWFFSVQTSRWECSQADTLIAA